MTPEKITELKRRVELFDKEAAKILVREAKRSNNVELWDWVINECQEMGTRLMLEVGAWSMLREELIAEKDKWAFEKSQNKFTVVRQNWEESERGWGTRPDGCSLHMTYEDHKRYCDAFWDRQRTTLGTNTVPDEYDRESGKPFPVLVPEEVFNELKENGGSLRLWRPRLHKIKMERVET